MDTPKDGASQEIVGSTDADEVLARIAANRNASQCDVVAKPGSQHALAAYKDGTEDEYIDKMRGRYGGEW